MLASACDALLRLLLLLVSHRCGPCRVAFPHLSQLAQKHRSSGLVVVGINMEADSPQIRAFVQQQVRLGSCVGRGLPTPGGGHRWVDRGSDCACLVVLL